MDKSGRMGYNISRKPVGAERCAVHQNDGEVDDVHV